MNTIDKSKIEMKSLHKCWTKVYATTFRYSGNHEIAKAAADTAIENMKKTF